MVDFKPQISRPRLGSPGIRGSVALQGCTWLAGTHRWPVTGTQATPSCLRWLMIDRMVVSQVMGNPKAIVEDGVLGHVRIFRCWPCTSFDHVILPAAGADSEPTNKGGAWGMIVCVACRQAPSNKCSFRGRTPHPTVMTWGGIWLAWTPKWAVVGLIPIWPCPCAELYWVKPGTLWTFLCHPPKNNDFGTRKHCGVHDLYYGGDGQDPNNDPPTVTGKISPLLWWKMSSRNSLCESLQEIQYICKINVTKTMTIPCKDFHWNCTRQWFEAGLLICVLPPTIPHLWFTNAGTLALTSSTQGLCCLEGIDPSCIFLRNLHEPFASDYSLIEIYCNRMVSRRLFHG